MAVAVLHSRALAGVAAPCVTVEVHIAGGLPGIHLVGLPDTEVREARDRVRAAMQNAQFEFPARKVTVNLAPADLPKESGRYDLPIALGILAATGQIPSVDLPRYEFAGELALTGELRAVRGALAMALSARRDGRAFVLPEASASEAAMVQGATVFGARSLLAVCAHLTARTPLVAVVAIAPRVQREGLDLIDVRGQKHAKRALEIAAAGGHSLLFMGPPGTGKSMLAHRLPALLPPLAEDEALEVAAVASIAGRFVPGGWGERPFRAPHHTASAVALVGGGSDPRPGEISLAHHGVLFLDELPEWDRRVLEVLREPLETGVIHISRAARQSSFPGAIPADRGDESLSMWMARRSAWALPLHARSHRPLSFARVGAAARSHRPDARSAVARRRSAGHAQRRAQRPAWLRRAAWRTPPPRPTRRPANHRRPCARASSAPATGSVSGKASRMRGCCPRKLRCIVCRMRRARRCSRRR